MSQHACSCRVSIDAKPRPQMSPVRQHQLLGLGLGGVDIGIDLEALHERILSFISVKAPMDPDLLGNLCIIDTPDYNPGTTVGAAASNHSTAASLVNQT